MEGTVYSKSDLKQFHAALDEIAHRLQSGELATPAKYSEVFTRGLSLVRQVSFFDLPLAKDILRNMVESSVVLLLASNPDHGMITIRIGVGSKDHEAL